MANTRPKEEICRNWTVVACLEIRIGAVETPSGFVEFFVVEQSVETKLEFDAIFSILSGNEEKNGDLSLRIKTKTN
jgi:hypothetical protein